MNGNYKRTIALLNILQLAGWLVMMAGAIGGFMTYRSEGLLGAAFAAGPVFVVGLILMAVSQVSGVLIDIARSNQAIFEALKSK